LAVGTEPVRCQIEEALFGSVQLGDAHGQVRPDLFVGRTLVREKVDELLTDGRGEVIGEFVAAVFLKDGLLEKGDWEVRQVTDPVLASPADVVLPAVAVATSGEDVQHPGLPTGLVAALTEQHAPQVVVVFPVPGAPSGSGIEGFLNPVEQFWTDQRRVPSWVFGSVIDNDPL
jgi:hypothetical protein